MPTKLNNQNFKEEVLQSDELVFVDFWAPWCGPCKMIAPIVDKLEENYGDQMKFAKLNVQDYQETAGEYGVRGIPTLAIFKNGEIVKKFVGLKPYELFEEEIKKVL